MAHPKYKKAIRQALQTNHPSGAVKEKAKLDKLISRLKHHAK